MRRGDVDPLHFGMGIGADTKEMDLEECLGIIEGDGVCFASIWSGSN